MLRNKSNIAILIFAAFMFAFMAEKTVFSANIQSKAAPVRKLSNNEFNFKREVLKFMPFNELDKLLKTNKKLVYMSYKDLKKLIKEKTKPEENAPVDYIVRDINLTGEVKEDYISFIGDYNLDILNKKWTQIPLLSINTGLKKIDFVNKNSAINTNESFFNFISGAIGEHNINVKFDVKNTKTGNNSSASFSIPDVAIAKLKIKHPLNTSELKISNSTGLNTKVYKDYKLTSANIAGKGDVNISWKNIKPVRAEYKKKIKKIKEEKRPARVVSDINTLISIDEGLLQGFSNFSFRIYHSPVEQFVFEIPHDIEIIDVSSSQNIINKGNYKISGIEKNKQKKLLTVYLNSKIKDKLNLNIIYEKTYENKKAELNIPDIKPVGKEINKTSGYIAVQSGGNAEIKPVSAKNISRLDISELPGSLRNYAEYPLIAAFSYINKDFSLVFEVTPHEDAPVQVAIADKAYGDSRLSSNGVLTSQVKYNVRNMSEQFFKFNLPEKEEILSAAINEKPVKIEKENADKQNNTIYYVNIKNYQDSNPFNLVIMYRQKFDSSILSNLANFKNIEMPKLINIPLLTVSWSVYAPENMKFWNFSNLNTGNKNYYNFISTSNMSGSSQYGRNRTSMPSQVAPNTMLDHADKTEYEDKKVAGILPPEFSMPPVKGLKEYKFSDYLTGMESIEISMLGITYWLYFLMLLALVYISWQAFNKIHTAKYIENKNPRQILKSIIPEILVILIIGFVINSHESVLLLVITAISYAVYEFTKNKHLKHNHHNGEI